jgi:hypothetical protein
MIAPGFLVLLIGSISAAQGQSVDWEPRVSQEAPKAWAEYEARAKRLQGSWSTVLRSRKTQEVESETRGEFKQRDGCAYIVSNHITELDCKAQVMNPRYAFELGRARPDSDWAVKATGARLWTPATVQDPAYCTQRIVRNPFTLACFGDGLQVTIFDPGFSLRTVTPVEDAGRNLVKVEFNYQPPTDADPKKNSSLLMLHGGWLLLDPQHFWIIRKCAIDRDWGKETGTEIADFDYQNTDDGFPILKRVVRTSNRPKDGDLEFVYEYDLHEGDVPEREFTLGAFGFPEPGGATQAPRPTPWYLWFAIAGAVSLAVGIIFFRRARKIAEIAKP